jgi:chitin disaccharide deacetylase
MRQLIVNADDFGFTPSVNRGILEAHAAGVVTATSVMIGMPGWADARERLRDSTIDVGLHLNLGVGDPLTSARTLVNRRTGAFRSVASLVMRALAGLVDPSDVAAETRAQIEALRAAGRPITHLDSHWHLHTIPGIWQPVLTTTREEGIAWIRSPVIPLTLSIAGRSTPFQLMAIASRWRRARRPDDRPPRAVDHFAGWTIGGWSEYDRGFVAILDALPAGLTELMVHPGYNEPALAALDSYTAAREQELAALTGPKVRARLARGDIALTHFGAGIFPS